MQTVEALHREAMESIDRAILARQCGDIDRAVKALELVTAHQKELLEAWRQIHGET